jgi:hypothetical protein
MLFPIDLNYLPQPQPETRLLQRSRVSYPPAIKYTLVDTSLQFDRLLRQYLNDR